MHKSVMPSAHIFFFSLQRHFIIANWNDFYFAQYNFVVLYYKLIIAACFKRMWKLCKGYSETIGTRNVVNSEKLQIVIHTAQCRIVVSILPYTKPFVRQIIWNPKARREKKNNNNLEHFLSLLLLWSFDWVFFGENVDFQLKIKYPAFFFFFSKLILFSWCWSNLFHTKKNNVEQSI